jgi:hypothetical protein
MGVAAMLLLAACSPEDVSMGNPELGSADLVEGTNFKIEADASNPNLIHLTSLMPTKYQIVWSHPGLGAGHSKGPTADLKIAFAGDYQISFGVDTKAGVVYSAPVDLKISSFCAEFVTGDMWEYLTGGAGKSKTWVPDNGNYGMKQGFYSCFEPSATHLDMTHDDGKNNWYAKDKTWWEPSNADIGITADDLAQTMTFSLQGKAGLTVTKVVDGKTVTTEGSFVMDADNYTISAIGVEFPHGAWANGKAVDFSSNYQILYMDENQLMIANYRDEGLSGEGKCIYCWNFVSKDYADSYVAPTVEEPTLPSTWENDLSQTVNKTIVWQMSDATPFDWCNLDGSLKNGFSGLSAYPNWCTPASNVSDIKLTMRSGTKEYSVALPDGSTVSGTYTVSSTGIYTFSNGLGSTLIGGTWVNFAADNTNQLRVMQYKTSDGNVTDMWLGAKNLDNTGTLYQYLGYHFVATTEVAKKGYKSNLNFFNTSWGTQGSGDISITDAGQYTFTISGSDTAPYGLYLDVLGICSDHPNATLTLNKIMVDDKEVPFDNSLISYGHPDDKDLTSLRIYVLNPWANPACFTDPSVFAFTKSIAVTFTVAFND